VFGIDFRRWFDRMQPQTLQLATWLLYFDGFFGMVTLLDGSGYQGFLVRRYAIGFIVCFSVVVAYVAGGLLMANERRLGYRIAVAAAFSPFILRIWALRGAQSTFNFGGDVSLLDYLTGRPFGLSYLTVLFDIALVALLLHRQSREHARIWFR
jgi:hypothetical protein